MNALLFRFGMLIRYHIIGLIPKPDQYRSISINIVNIKDFFVKYGRVFAICCQAIGANNTERKRV